MRPTPDLTGDPGATDALEAEITGLTTLAEELRARVQALEIERDGLRDQTLAQARELGRLSAVDEANQRLAAEVEALQARVRELESRGEPEAPAVAVAPAPVTDPVTEEGTAPEAALVAAREALAGERWAATVALRRAEVDARTALRAAEETWRQRHEAQQAELRAMRAGTETVQTEVAETDHRVAALERDLTAARHALAKAEEQQAVLERRVADRDKRLRETKKRLDRRSRQYKQIMTSRTYRVARGLRRIRHPRGG